MSLWVLNAYNCQFKFHGHTSGDEFSKIFDSLCIFFSMTSVLSLDNLGFSLEFQIMSCGFVVHSHDMNSE